MRLHPRAQAVAIAQTTIRIAVDDMALEHGLTDAELIQGLAMHLASLTGYAVRGERYPDGDPDEG